MNKLTLGTALKISFLPVVAAAGILTLSLGGCSAAGGDEYAMPEKLVFAGAPLQADADAQATYQLMIDLLEEELGIPIEFYETTDRAAIVEAIAADRVDIASMDPYGYVLATGLSSDVEIISVAARSKDTTPGFYSFGLARSDDDSITSLADAKGKKICFSDPASTAGFLFPAKGLSEVGIDPKVETTKDISPIFTGIFPIQPAVNVANGDCDLGFVSDGQYERVLPTTGLVKDGALKVVWKSELIPGYTLAVNKTMPSELFEKIKEIVNTKANKTYFVETGKCTSEEECYFQSPVNWGYVSEVDTTFDSVRKTCEVLGLNQCKKKQ
jgi:phosphonate transport system substrate-binding protein